MITITSQTENRICLNVPKVGYVQLSKHSTPANRPWHIVTFGRNYPTPEECIKYLETIAANWDDEEDNEPTRQQPYHSEMTHSFLATEADLDSCPY